MGIIHSIELHIYIKPSSASKHTTLAVYGKKQKKKSGE